MQGRMDIASGVTDVGVKKQFASETSKLKAVCFAQLTLARWSWEPGCAVIFSFNHGHPFKILCQKVSRISGVQRYP